MRYLAALLAVSALIIAGVLPTGVAAIIRPDLGPAITSDVGCNTTTGAACTTAAISVPTGSYLALFVVQGNTSHVATHVSDSSGDTFVNTTYCFAGFAGLLVLYTSAAAGGGASVTFSTVTPTTSYVALFAYAVTAGSVKDVVTAPTTCIGDLAAQYASVSLTSHAANELYLASFGTHSGGVICSSTNETSTIDGTFASAESACFAHETFAAAGQNIVTINDLDPVNSEGMAIALMTPAPPQLGLAPYPQLWPFFAIGLGICAVFSGISLSVNRQRRKRHRRRGD